jgi:hypothetical protein
VATLIDDKIRDACCIVDVNSAVNIQTVALLSREAVYFGRRALFLVAIRKGAAVSYAGVPSGLAHQLMCLQRHTLSVGCADVPEIRVMSEL